jgi:hypothetical protein
MSKEDSQAFNKEDKQILVSFQKVQIILFQPMNHQEVSSQGIQLVTRDRVDNSLLEVTIRLMEFSTIQVIFKISRSLQVQRRNLDTYPIFLIKNINHQ